MRASERDIYRERSIEVSPLVIAEALDSPAFSSSPRDYATIFSACARPFDSRAVFRLIAELEITEAVVNRGEVKSTQIKPLGENARGFSLNVFLFFSKNVYTHYLTVYALWD